MKTLRFFATDELNTFMYEAICPVCKDQFLYKSHGILRQLYDKPRFDLFFADHKYDCLQEKLKEFEKGDSQ